MMGEMGLSGEPPPRRPRTTDSVHDFPRSPNLVEALEVVRPDQVWVSDITYIRLKKEFIYLAVLMDVFSRSIRGWNLGRSLEQELTLAALMRALGRGKPEIHHSDQGVQYVCSAYAQRLLSAGARISMAAKGTPLQNAQAERFFRTLKQEEVYLHDYQTFAEAEASIGRFIEAVYNQKRLHSALGYRPPAEFEQLFLNGTL